MMRDTHDLKTNVTPHPPTTNTAIAKAAVKEPSNSSHSSIAATTVLVARVPNASRTGHRSAMTLTSSHKQEHVDARVALVSPAPNFGNIPPPGATTASSGTTQPLRNTTCVPTNERSPTRVPSSRTCRRAINVEEKAKEITWREQLLVKTQTNRA